MFQTSRNTYERNLVPSPRSIRTNRGSGDEDGLIEQRVVCFEKSRSVEKSCVGEPDVRWYLSVQTERERREKNEESNERGLGVYTEWKGLSIRDKETRRRTAKRTSGKETLGDFLASLVYLKALRCCSVGLLCPRLSNRWCNDAIQPLCPRRRHSQRRKTVDRSAGVEEDAKSGITSCVHWTKLPSEPVSNALLHCERVVHSTDDNATIRTRTRVRGELQRRTSCSRSGSLAVVRWILFAFG